MYLVERPMDDRETLLRKKLVAKQEKQLTFEFTQEAKDDEILEVENQLAKYNDEKTKARLKWKLEEEMLGGVLLTYTDERYHAKMNAATSCYAVWKLLKKESNQDEPGQLMTLLEKYFKFDYQPNEKLLDGLARLELIGQKIKDRGVVPTFEQMMCYIALIRMPTEYNALQQQIFQIDDKDLKMDLIAKKFSHEDARLQSKKDLEAEKKGSSKTNREEALIAQTDDKRNRNRGGRGGRDAGRGGERQQGGSNDQRRNNQNDNGDNNKDQNKLNQNQVKCLNHATCKRFVNPKYAAKGSKRCSTCHYQHCLDHPEERKNNNPKDANYAQLFNVEVEKVAYNTTTTTPPPRTNNREKKWILDSGCTSNVSNSARDVVNLRQSEATIRGPTGEKSNASQIGDAIFNINIDGKNEKMLFRDTIVVPELKKNLLSVNAVCSSSPNISVIFTKDDCQIFKGEVKLDGQTLIQGKVDAQGLYILSNTLDVTLNNSVFNTTTNVGHPQIISMTLQQAHDAYGHVSKDQILKLQQNTIGLKISNPKDPLTCTICDAAKMNRKKFAKVIPPLAEKPGEVLYSDLAGKISPPTKGGCHYIAHFMDAHSGYVFATNIQKKSDTLAYFKEVRAKIETQIGVKPKRLCSDNGGEYIGADFQNFLKEKGMIHQKSPPNTPQRAGRSERLNKILFDGARAMLAARKMPRDFWGAAVRNFVRIYNCTTKDGEEKSRYEKFFGKKPNLKHCLPFGCPVMVHNHDPHIKKLDDRAFQGIYIGFNEDNHNYQIWLLEEKKMIESRSIKAYPDEFVVFADYKHVPFLVDNTDNWLGEERIEDQQIENPNIDEESPNADEEEDEIIGEDIFGNPIFAYQLATKPNIRKSTTTVKRSMSELDQSKQTWLSDDQISEVLALEEVNTPKNHKEAMQSPQKEKWRQAEKKELESLIENQVFEIMPRPKNRRILRAKPVYKIKSAADTKEDQFKVRCVAEGFRQKEGMDYFEVFAPTLKNGSARYLISIAAMKKLNIQHLDVQCAFLNGKLEEEIYIEIPEAFADDIKADRSTHVLKLNKSLYGLKQSSRVWNDTFTTAIQEMGFKQSEADPCVFINYVDSTPTAWIGIFVDDCWIIAEDEFTEKIGKMMDAKFKMHNLGKLTYSLGMQVEQTKGYIKISQPEYIDKLAEKFGLADSSKKTTPLPKKPQADAKNSKPFDKIPIYQQMVGGLIWVANATRPDIAYPVGYLARSMQKPTIADWKNAKRVIRYLKSTRMLGLKYSTTETTFGYSDASYAEEKDAKSASGYVFKQAGAAITWRSTKQELVAQSSMEAEYIALAEAVKEAIWIRKLQQECLPNANHQIVISEDNQSAIKLAQNPIHTNRSKHINVRYHATRDYVKKKLVKIEYCPTEDMVADIMTKSLDYAAHAKFVAALGLVD